MESSRETSHFQQQRPRHRLGEAGDPVAEPVVLERDGQARAGFVQYAGYGPGDAVLVGNAEHHASLAAQVDWVHGLNILRLLKGTGQAPQDTRFARGWKTQLAVHAPAHRVPYRLMELSHVLLTFAAAMTPVGELRLAIPLAAPHLRSRMVRSSAGGSSRKHGARAHPCSGSAAHLRNPAELSEPRGAAPAVAAGTREASAGPALREIRVTGVDHTGGHPASDGRGHGQGRLPRGCSGYRRAARYL